VKARVVGGYLVTSDGRIAHFLEKELYVGSNWMARLSLPGVEEELVDRLEACRLDANAPILITSGVRTKNSNIAVGGASNSLHLTGGAADFHARGFKPWDWVSTLEHVTFRGSIGRFGIYHADQGGHCHLDIDTMSALRRFVKIGTVYHPLEQWVESHFPGVPIPDVDPVKANRLLGF